MKENKSVIAKTVDYIEAHLNESVKLDDIAKAVGYSKYHLNRMFTESKGQTIHKYIQERRLSESAKKLLETDKHIVEIAQDWGYTSQQSYTLAFRQYFYCTPQVYRQLNSLQINKSNIRMFKNYYKGENNVVYLISRGVMAA